MEKIIKKLKDKAFMVTIRDDAGKKIYTENKKPGGGFMDWDEANALADEIIKQLQADTQVFDEKKVEEPPAFTEEDIEDAAEDLLAPKKKIYDKEDIKEDAGGKTEVKTPKKRVKWSYKADEPEEENGEKDNI
jgi:polyhydroxyalkanoate synthesis regulator phasin